MKVKCEICGTKFDKWNYQMKKDKHHFCSRKCSNINRNNIRWKGHTSKRKLNVKCTVCGKYRDWRGENGLCNNCNKKTLTEQCKSITIKEIKNKYQKKLKSRWYSVPIRGFAKSWNKTLRSHSCQKCGYDKHTELCHITPINKADENITLGEINDPSNLLVLCPNHHWEFDNGVLELKDIPNRNGEAGGS